MAFNSSVTGRPRAKTASRTRPTTALGYREDDYQDEPQGRGIGTTTQISYSETSTVQISIDPRSSLLSVKKVVVGSSSRGTAPSQESVQGRLASISSQFDKLSLRDEKALAASRVASSEKCGPPSRPKSIVELASSSRDDVATVGPVASTPIRPLSRCRDILGVITDAKRE